MNRSASGILAIATIVFTGIFSARGVLAADWTTYLNGNARVGTTSEILATDLQPAWVRSTPVPLELAWEGPREDPIEGLVMKHRVAYDEALHPVAADGRVYFGSSVDHQLYCVDAKTGRTVWTFFTEGPIRLAPTLHAGRVYFGSDDGCVYCLDGKTGRQIWTVRVAARDERLLARGHMISRWPVRTGVLIDDGVAYFGAGIFPHENVYLCAADADTGKIIWKNDHISQQDAGRNDLSPQGYLLANQDLLFVPSGRSMPVAFDKKTGKQVFKRTFSWRTSGGGVVGGSRAVLSDGQLYSAGAHHFLALNENTGSAGFAYIPGRQITFRERMAYIANAKAVVAVDLDQHAAASVKRQELFVQRRSYRGDAKKLAEIDAQMAELARVGILWQTPFTGDAALVLTGNLVVAGGDGEVVALDIETGENVWQTKVDGKAAGIAVAGGTLLVSTSVGKIYAYAADADVNADIGSAGALAKNSPFDRDELTPIYEAAADEIVKQTDVRQGYCLVMGSERGRLAFELAKRTKLRIYGIEPDEQKVAAARRALNDAGLYGHRVTIIRANADNTPLSNYFANLVVSDSMLLTGRLPVEAVELGRFVKPCGGIACFGTPQSVPPVVKTATGENLKDDLISMYLRDDAEVEVAGSWAILRRGKLAGAGEWSHQYGNTANTCFVPDSRVKGSLGVLWYGDPGPEKMINRHEAASAPLSTNGRFFTQGVDSVRAYDAYNGLFLWEYKNPGAIRTGVFNNYETSNLAASDDHLFVVVDDTCTVLDAATGQVVAEHKSPQSDDGVPRSWGYVAHYDGLLYGTATIRTELAASLRRRGRTIGGTTDAIFAIDPHTQQSAWTYHGKNIMHVTIAIGDGRLFFIESTISQEERDALLRQDKSALKELSAEEAKKKEAELKALDARIVVALDAKTGKELWRQPVDVTFCSGVSAGGGNLALMYENDHVLICGANANGHYWRQFLSGEFSKRRLVVLNAQSGEKIWSKDADYMNRPAINDGFVYAEPWAFDLTSGEEKTRQHPITGEETKWRFSRPGHHCGVITGTPNMMFFRSGFIGYYDLYSDSGTSHFAGQRLGCWVNAIPGNGLVMIPEASAGCVCLFSITSTVVLEPREDRNASWGIYSAVGPQTPVKKLAVNLGAPGDRRDAQGTLWLGFPRPQTVGRLEYVFDIQPKHAGVSQPWYDNNADTIEIKDTETDWIYASGARGLLRCELPLLGEKDEPAEYTVKLHFADLDNSRPGQRLFDIKLQGVTVASDIDTVKETGGSQIALVKRFTAIPVDRNLVIELVPKSDSPDTDRLPTICGIEVEREKS